MYVHVPCVRQCVYLYTDGANPHFPCSPLSSVLEKLDDRKHFFLESNEESSSSTSERSWTQNHRRKSLRTYSQRRKPGVRSLRSKLGSLMLVGSLLRKSVDILPDVVGKEDTKDICGLGEVLPCNTCEGRMLAHVGAAYL